MLLISWLNPMQHRSLRTGAKRRPGQRPTPRRLNIEPLESRCVLSTLSIQDTGVSENVNPIVNVILSEASTQPVTVDFTTVDGTAKAPQDYKATAGTLRFEPGETTKGLLVEFRIDNKIEPTEYLFVNLSNPTNADIADGQATVSLFDAPNPPGGGGGGGGCHPRNSRQCLTAAASTPSPVSGTLTDEEVQPLLTEALARWHGTGVTVSSLSTIDVRIADLPGATLGEAVGHTIWLDANAAGWGWFVDRTPGDDSEYVTPGNQGERDRMDLLSVLVHETGHVLGFGHQKNGVMNETLGTGVRPSVTGQPAREYLLVPSKDTDNVLRYDAATGAFVDEFVRHKDGGLNQPVAAIFGPFDHDLYVSCGFYGGPGQKRAVLRFDGETGEFLEEFTEPGHLEKVGQVLFGPDGNGDGRRDLYVRNGIELGPGSVMRFDGTTGAFIDEFVPYRDDLRGVGGMVFGPSVEDPNRLDLYTASGYFGHILRFNGDTGAYLGVFADPPSAGLGYAVGMTFGPDGNLYVALNAFLPPHDTIEPGQSNGVGRYQGPGGMAPGAFIDHFVPPGSGGLLDPFGGILFGPDGNGDGYQDLYLPNAQWVSSYETKKHTSTVKRYDGVTGAFIDTFVKPDSGGLSGPWGMTFTETDPMTKAYNGAPTASSTATSAQLAALTATTIDADQRTTAQAGSLVASPTASQLSSPLVVPAAEISPPVGVDQVLGQIGTRDKSSPVGLSDEHDWELDLLADLASAALLD